MDEPTPPSGKGDGPVEGWVRPEAWVAPPRRGSEVTRYRVAVVVVVMLIAVGVGGLVYGFMGGDPNAPFVLPWEAAPGPIEFGTGGTGCALTDRATTFPSSAGFRVVATLNRPLRAGEATSWFVDGPSGRGEAATEQPSALAECLYSDFGRGHSPGHYAVEIRAGLELLAYGKFDITP